MLHILLLILKIIGIILAIILGLALVVISVVLFVPIRYRASGVVDTDTDKKEFQIRFHWFFHVLSGYANYKDDAFSWKVRFFWKTWKEDEEPKEIETIEKQEVIEPEKTDEWLEVDEKHFEEKDSKTTTTHKKPTGKKEKKKYTIRKMCDKIIAIKEFITDEKHKSALKVIKKELFRLLRVLRPKKLRGYVLFGCEDPYNTGQILAILSVLYPWYAEAVEIEPNFEEKILKTDFSAKGKIHLIWFVVIIWNLYFNDSVMSSYRDWKKLNEES